MFTGAKNSHVFFDQNTDQMKCNRCGQMINEGDAMDYHGQTLCEDCYIRALSPNRACDPWAVRSAQTLSQVNEPYAGLSATQARILQVLQESGGLEADTLAQTLNLKPSELESELATLRHMEKIHARMQAGKKIICLWEL
jgi:hypothetical protein